METRLICLYVRAEQFLMVDADLIHASDHRFSAEVSKERVVELNIAWCIAKEICVSCCQRSSSKNIRTASKCVQLFDLFLVGHSDIREVLIYTQHDK